ncbi:MAG: hypothetical protein E7057_07030 [Lentisphaerae bacterium]|nr:hypothetical protein [Lentisphaerota bacterium]
MEQDFDLFDFADSQAAAAAAVVTQTQTLSAAPGTPPAEPPAPSLSKAELRQAAMAFLATLHPAGIAANVPTRRSKYRVAAAGFWRPPTARKTNVITKTAIVVMYDDVDCCFSDCAGRDERIAVITALQEEKSALEAIIRETEPHLGAADDLFSDFRSWDYASSANPAYRKLTRKLDRELKALTQGSKLEYIRRAGNADLCFLAIPENLVDPAVIPLEWGIVELTANPKGFKLIRNAMQLAEVTPEGRLQLALNIATSAASAACFANGVDSNGSMRRPPRRRPYFFSREKK